MADEANTELLEEGDRFGDYTVIRLLGKGGMGAVYLMWGASGSQYAVKIMYPGKMSHDMRRRFANEAAFALNIRHRNLVSVYDVGEDPETGLCYMIMDYVSGGTLSDLLRRRGRLPPEEAVSIASQVALGLEVAHRHGLVHRDVKPDNILFDADGTPRLSDLGAAKFDEGQASIVTTTGMVIGTPAYMAPEQMLNSHEIDARADIYSLGVVLYEMLSGKRPNEGRTAIELMAKAIKGEPLPDIRTACPELSAAIAQVVATLCAPKPEDRPQTALDASDILRKAASGKLVLTKKRPRPPAADAAARRRLAKGLAAGVGIAAFLFLGVAGWLKALSLQERAKPPTGTSVTNAPGSAVAGTGADAPTSAAASSQSATNLYCVIDLSGGPTASSYPVSYLDAVPNGEWSYDHKTTKLVLRRIEPGTFIMGEDQNDESHRVTITKPFYIGVFEVTQRQYELVMDSNPSRHGGMMRPVGGVSWEDIRGSEAAHDWPNVRSVDPASFAGRLRARTGLAFDLPTEAQWEYACRAGTKSRLYDGSEEPTPENVARLARYTFNQKARGYGEREETFHMHKPDGKGGFDIYCTSVGMYQPNAWGLYDMYGNVWELCVSRDLKVFGTDPEGETNGGKRIVRGGSWDCWIRHQNELTSVNVARGKPTDRPDTYGFRISFMPGVKPLLSLPAEPQKAEPRKSVTDNRVRYAKAGAHTWYYTLKDGEAMIWRGHLGFDRETLPAVDPRTDEEVVVPSELDGYKVTAIGNLAFLRCKAMKSIVIPEGVREIRGWAFYACENLKSVRLPASLKRIHSAFAYCNSLETVDIRDCTDVSGASFGWCPRLSRVTVSQTNPAYVEVDGALYTKDRETLVFFPRTASSVSLPGFVKRIGKGAFYTSEKLKSALIHKGIIEIDTSAFLYCHALDDVRIEPGLRSVGDSAFGSCSSLRHIEFPATLERIGDSIFSSCVKLERVAFYGNAPAFNGSRQDSTLGKTPGRLVIAVKRGTRGWKAPETTELPDVWPVEGVYDSRPIQFIDDSSGDAKKTDKPKTKELSDPVPSYVSRNPLHAAYRSKDRKRVFVEVAHWDDGNTFKTPPLTIERAMESISCGADIVSLKVGISRDKTLFSVGGDYLEDFSNGEGFTHNFSARELERMKVKRRSGSIAGRLVSFEDLLRRAKNKVLFKIYYDAGRSPEYVQSVLSSLANVLNRHNAWESVILEVRDAKNMREMPVKGLWHRIRSGELQIMVQPQEFQEWASVTPECSVWAKNFDLRIFGCADIPQRIDAGFTYGAGDAERTDDEKGWRKALNDGVTVFRTGLPRDLVKFLKRLNRER